MHWGVHQVVHWHGCSSYQAHRYRRRPVLIEQAVAGGGGDFHLASYEDVAAGRFRIAADAVVCNFSLLGKESSSRSSLPCPAC